MGIRTIRGHRYYYRSVRRGGRVRSEFVAAGARALLLAECDRITREVQAERRRLAEAERRESEAMTGVLVGWSRGVDDLVGRALESAGFHRHKRGEWRRRKVTTEATTSGIQPAAPAPAPAPMTPEVRAIERRFRDKDKTVTRKEAKMLLDARPGLGDSHGLSPVINVLACLLSPYAGDQVRYELLRRKFFEVRAELEGPDATAMERLLAERAALCWLDLYLVEAGCIALEGDGKATAAQMIYFQKRIDAAHRRFLSAIKALAVVRKLKVPDLKVNIDGRSVHFNTAAPVPAEGPAPSIDVTPGPR